MLPRRLGCKLARKCTGRRGLPPAYHAHHHRPWVAHLPLSAAEGISPEAARARPARQRKQRVIEDDFDEELSGDFWDLFRLSGMHSVRVVILVWQPRWRAPADERILERFTLAGSPGWGEAAAAPLPPPASLVRAHVHGFEPPLF